MRDGFDFGWRERNGRPAPTVPELHARLTYVFLEGQFAVSEYQAEFAYIDNERNVTDTPQVRERRSQRMQLAGYLFDSLIEPEVISRNIYSGIRPDELADNDLVRKMRERAQSALAGQDLAPLLPSRITLDDQETYARDASRGRLVGRRGFVTPYNIPTRLFSLVGTFADIIDYNTLTDVGEINIPNSVDDGITLENFVNGEEVVLIQNPSPVPHVFKREPFIAFLNNRFDHGQPFANPLTNEVITDADLRRGTARVVVGGGRRSRRSRRRRLVQTRRRK
jgi:hypothetical protein